MPYLRLSLCAISSVLLLLVAGERGASAQTLAPQERLCDPAFEDCREDVLRYIQQETVAIDMGFWMMTDARYANELVKAWQRGVKIRLLMDPRCAEAHAPCVTQNNQLRDAGIPMRNRLTGGILHWKMALFVGQGQLQFAGANYAPFEFSPEIPYVNYTDELVAFTNDPSLVHSFMTKFDDLWTSTSEFANFANITTPLVRSFPTYPIDPELNFPPDDSYRTRAVAAYTAENQQIDVQMFRITDGTHADAMIAAVNRGVPVRLITDETEYRNPTRLWDSYNVDRMLMAGVQVRLDGHQGIDHEKAISLWGTGLSIFGSSNWTDASSDSQREHNYFTVKPWVATWLKAQFKRKWNNETGFSETKPFVPLPPGAPGYQAPAVATTGVPTTGVVLSWDAGFWAHKYDIYFGTTPNPPLLEANRQLGPSQYSGDYRTYALPELLPGTTYYWKIVSKTMALASAEGPVWRFTTAGIAPPPPPPPTITLVRGPYLQQPTDRSMVIVWATREAGSAEVRYATPSGPASVPAVSRLVSSAATAIGYDYYQHEAVLTGLAAATTYSYQPFVSGVAVSPAATFRTAPAAGSGTVSFIAYGDSGTGSPEQRQLAALMAGDSFDFAMHVGDIAYGAASGTGDASYATYQSFLFDIYGWLPSVPFVPVEGNHDSRATNGDGAAYLDLFSLPRNGATAARPDHAERYYSFDYGPVHFVALDTEFAFQDPARRADQLAWLDADLASTTQPWTIAFYHRAPYSSGGEHGSDLPVREAFGPLLERYGVDLVLTGHEHDYERTIPIRVGPADTNQAVPYVVTGGGGAPLYPAATSAWTAFSASRHEYVKVTVDACTLTLSAVGLDGAAFDGTSISHCTTPPSNALPAGWNHVDVGATGAAGTATHDAGTFTLKGAGADVWGTADALQFAYRTLAGNGSIVARVASVQNVAPWTKAGVMIRNTSSPSSAQAFMLVSPGKGVAFQRRLADGAASVSTAGTFSTAPRWVKLTRAGNTIAAFESSDGSSWTQVATDTFSLGASLQIGLGISSHASGTLATAVFDNVVVTTDATPPPANVAPSVTLSSPIAGGTAPATIAVSATATDSDGTIAKVDFFAGATLIGTDTSAPYSVSWTNVAAGTYSVTAVATDNAAAATTSAPVTVTVTAPPPANVAPTVTLATPLEGGTAPATIAVSATATDSDGTIAKVDFFAGATLIGTDTSAPYSVSWTNVAAGTYSVTAVATDNAGAATTSAPATVTVTAPGGPALPAGWSNSDVGLTGSSGTTTFANGTFSVTGAGPDVWGTADAFQYAYRTLDGDGSIVARVASVQNVASWTKAGVMMRSSLSPGSAQGFMLVSWAKGIAFQRRLADGAASVSTAGVPTTAPRWVKLTRTGNTIAAFESADGLAWTLVASDTFAMGPSIDVGLAVSSHVTGTNATATFDNVVVTPSGTPPPANVAPSVTLSSPIAGGTAPATIAVSATATDSDGTIAKVDFFAGATLIGTDTSAPYSVSWTNVAAGTYSVTAVATDNAGAATTSAPVTVTVTAPPPANVAPSVTLSSPIAGGTAPATIAVSATATDSDGTIAKVEFFAGATLIGTDTSAPYSVSWTNVAAGTYSVTAIATDNAGAATTSAPVTVTVTAPPPANVAPSVTLSSPIAGGTAPATIAVSATATDSDGTIAKVEFFAGAALIGTDTSAPYSVSWTNVAAGTYSVTAVATDNAGAATTSAPVTVTVTTPGGPALPAGWSNSDVGITGSAGTTTFANGTFSVTGAGADVWGTADAFQYAYRTLDGDGSIVARVASVQNVASWTKAGVMMRSSLSPGSAQGFMLVSWAKGIAFQRRLADGAASVSTAGVPTTAPRWVKLTRTGNTIAAFESADGLAWTLVASDTFAMGPSIDVGLAVSSHVTGTNATATFDNVVVAPSGTPPPVNAAPAVSLTSPSAAATAVAPASFTVAATASDSDGTIARVEFFAGTTSLGQASTSPYSIVWSNVPAGTYNVTAVATDNLGASTTSSPVTVTVTTPPPPPAGLPDGWSNADVGSVSFAGNASMSDGTFTVTGAGADVWGTADQFQFAYRSWTGDGTLIARVASEQNVSSWVKSGVMIRQTLAPDSAHAFMLVSPAKGTAFQRRASAGGISASTSGPMATAPRWVRLTRSGDTFSAYDSADGIAWTLVGTDTIPMGTTVLVGLAVSSHNVGATATATFDNVTVR